jgi:putative nucleotidyltransferase with HDIG domain
MTRRGTTGVATPLAQAERVELILSQLTALPTLPAIALRLMEVTTSRESSAKDVVRIIESDPSLTAACLRMLRRADLGVRRSVVSVERAVVLLGFRAVRNAVLSLQIYDLFATADCDERRRALRSGFWKHSLAVACAAQLIGEHVKDLAPEELFVCGLLHDIGKIAMDTCLPKSYARIVEQVERRAVSISDAERELLGFDHTVTGKRLVTHWRLPLPVVECVWLHHQSPEALPSITRFPRHVQVVHLADTIVRRERIGFSGYPYQTPLEPQIELLGIPMEGVNQVASRLPEQIAQFVDVLGLDDVGAEADMTEALARANRELGRVNDLLWENRQALELRSLFFDALGRFTGRLSHQDRIADVCRAAAEALRDTLDLPRAVAFVLLEGSRCLQVGHADGSHEPPPTSMIDWHFDEGDDLSSLEALRADEGPAPAPEICEAIWNRCFLEGDSELLWIVPLREPGEFVGGVLLSGPEQNVQRFRRAGQECAALSRAFGMAVLSARARIEAERMNEELLDLNRRLHDAQERIVRTRSISMIGEMAAGAAHELNNPLAVIAGRAQMLAERTRDEEEKRALEVISQQAVRASGIVDELMDFAKPRAPEPVTQTLRDVLDSLRQHWQQATSLDDRQFQVRQADPDLTVHADPDQLREILDAVVANAVQATIPQTARLLINSPSVVSDDKVRIVIEDNGRGMTREVLERALDPFFSVRPAGRGRGLGLSRAYRLAELSGGRLWLDSTPNVGTRATVELPARPPSS